MQKSLIDDLNWRYATKKYNPEKKVTEEDLNFLLEAIRLAPTSYGLQPFHVLIVQDTDLREKLKPKAWNQSQITDASHLLVFCANKSLLPSDIDAYAENIAKTRGITLEQTSGFSSFVKGRIAELSDQEFLTWNSRQVYIALGQLLVACATRHIDATPMEGFEADAFDEILGLTGTNLRSTVLCPIGYRSEDDALQHLKKVRKSIDELFSWR